ncbi:degenerate transposase [Streptococcus pneumoniae]|nr:degenerate transposase [Streptococcus pneumoniae]
MSFIAQDFEKLDIITVLEGRTQAVIRSSEITFLNMIEPSDVASKSLLWICLALTMTWLNSFAFTLYNILAVL